jgi:hypothetical protein
VESPRQASGPARRNRSRIALVGVAAVVLALLAGLLLARQVLAPDPSIPNTGVNLGARVEVSPAAAFLSAVGESRQLTAQAFDAAGSPRAGTARWSSSHPAIVDVSAEGLIVARALGSSVITAVVDGVTSPPVLVVVAEPAAGVILVDDDQIVGRLQPAEPGAEPASTTTYRVELTGIAPKVGDLLGGTGEKPLAGRVVAVDGSTVTLRQVPLVELVPGLAIDEVIDLAHARIDVPPEIARLYDVSRNGDTFDFAPKATFNDLLTAARADAPIAMAGALPNGAAMMRAAAAVQGTAALPPFTECEADTTPSSETIPLSLEGSSPPSFSFDVHPTATILVSEENGFEKFVVGSSFKVSAAATLKIAAAFEGKLGCEAELWRFILPAPGLLGLGLGAIIPIKAGFEVSGKLTVTSIELGAEASAATRLDLGLVRPPGGSPSVLNNMGEVTTTWKPKVDGPSWTDVRLAPSLEIFGAADFLIGPPYLEALQLNLLRAKAGAKMAADWAPQPVQIADKAYASSYALTLEGGIEIGPKLTDIAETLGLSDIAATNLTLSHDLAHSPTGTVTADRPSYQAGESGVVKVAMEPGNLEFLGAYNVERLLLVQHLPGEDRVLDTSAGAAEGQGAFELRFTATGPLAAADLYAFVVTKFPPLDLFGLEVAKGDGGRIAFVSDREGSIDLYSMNPDGSDITKKAELGAVDESGSHTVRGLAMAGDGKTFAWCGQNAVGSGLHVMDGDGGNDRIVAPECQEEEFALSPDGTKIAIATSQGNDETHIVVSPTTGAGGTQVTPSEGGGQEAYPRWSADGSKLSFWRWVVDAGGLNRSQTGIYTMGAGGGEMTMLLQLERLQPGGAWSPNGAELAYVTSPAAGELAISAIGTSGGSPRLVAGGASPTWSPDGTKIAFVKGGDIWLVSSDGTNPTNLTASSAVDSYPTFITP